MTTETISGICPCCSYDKLLMYYGTGTSTHVEGCPNCGFGYSDNRGALNSTPAEKNGFSAWRDWCEHCVAVFQNIDGSSYEDRIKVLREMNDDDLRKIAFDITEHYGRSDDVKTTLFIYTPEEIEAYKKENCTIFRSAKI